MASAGTDSLPFPGPQKDYCACGCGVFGRLKKNGHVHMTRAADSGCRCRSCLGRNNRRSGLKKQRAAQKRLGVQSSKFGDSDEERWQDPYFANEVKSGKQCGPLLNWWRRVETQVLANEADHGDRRRPVRAIAMPADWGHEGLVVVRLSTWENHVAPALEEHYR